MKQENFFTANPDLLFYFERAIPWDKIVPLFEGPEADPAEVAASYRDALAVAGEYCGKEIAARASAVDEAGVRREDGRIMLSAPMERNLAGLRELGLTGLSLPRAHGGEGLPFSVHAAMFEIVARACPSTLVEYAFYTSPGAMIVRFGTEEQKQRWVPRLAKGEISGAVAMTEPEAGSDVGNVRTIAARQDGVWRLSGRKQFISNGQGDMTIVLARSRPDSHGLEGLSLFLLPRWIGEGEQRRENYQVERAEHKVCLNGSPTCALAFDGSDGELLGPEGEGWREILSFMNEARVGVGIQGLGIAQAALEAARDYAALRIQMGKPIREHPLVAEMLLDMEATVAGLRAVAYEASAAYDMVTGIELRLDSLPEGDAERPALESRRKRLAGYLRELTPLVKYFGSEEVVRVARQALQIHGGYGVVKEYDVERFLRESLILSIYEGTSQIQALMAMKDLIRLLLTQPARLWTGVPSPSLAQARLPGVLQPLYRRALGDLNASLRYLALDLVRGMGAGGILALARRAKPPTEQQSAYLLLHAERVTQMLAYLHIARLLGQQAARWPERQPLAARFLRRAAQLTRANRRIVESGDREVLVTIDRWQAETA